MEDQRVKMVEFIKLLDEHNDAYADLLLARVGKLTLEIVSKHQKANRKLTIFVQELLQRN